MAKNYISQPCQHLCGNVDTVSNLLLLYDTFLIEIRDVKLVYCFQEPKKRSVLTIE